MIEPERVKRPKGQATLARPLPKTAGARKGLRGDIPPAEVVYERRLVQAPSAAAGGAFSRSE
ncbi:MAG: hypothetical protein IJ125_06710 [Atopobiaceae bacterium]|nr:hypothetical protein [Atopobiaceae bacterium]